MKQYLVIAAAVLAISASCSKAPENVAPTAPAATPAATPQTEFTDANAALAEGKRLLDENQTELAIQVLQKAVELNPDLAEGYFQLGIAYALLDMQKEQAGEAPEAPPANSKAARIKTKSELAFEKAVEAYKKWIKANREDDTAFFNLGRTYSKLGEDEDAEEAFRDAVKIKPEDSEYQTELGAVLIKLAKYHEAVAALKKAIELDATNARAIDLLEDAEAGRNRLDYKPDKDKDSNTNSNSSSRARSSNSNSDGEAGPSNTNAAPKPTPASTRPKADDPKAKKTPPAANRPN